MGRGLPWRLHSEQEIVSQRRASVWHIVEGRLSFQRLITCKVGSCFVERMCS